MSAKMDTLLDRTMHQLATVLTYSRLSVRKWPKISPPILM